MGVKASAILRDLEAVKCAGTVAVIMLLYRVVLLRAAVSTMRFEMVSSRFNVYCSDIVTNIVVLGPNSFGCTGSRALGGSNNLISFLW